MKLAQTATRPSCSRQFLRRPTSSSCRQDFDRETILLARAEMAPLLLSPAAARVSPRWVEKSIATPQYYPMSVTR